MRNVLIVGGGGREHALEWKCSQSKLVEKVYCAPGNGGTQNNIPLKPNDFEGLARFAEERSCFTVVGPEDPLAGGIVDYFLERDLPIFGPTKGAAKLEASKEWAKNFFARHGIPTADYYVTKDPDKAKDCVVRMGAPIVIKTSGLSAGKGSVVCATIEEAFEAIEQIMVKKIFESAGDTVVIEEFLEGEEASFLVLTDGREIEALATSQDHKKIGEGDTGLNTGGMGAYSPAPVVTEEIHKAILRYTRKIVDGMRSEGVEFRGVLYDGVIISDNKIQWLEDNVRFGDPEAQPIVMRMKSDLYPYLVACSEGRLGEMEPIEWRKEAAVCVVMASGGYPVKYETGKTIFGLDEAGLMEDVVVFHAGTTKKGESIVTSGGRVLGVTALGAGVEAAIQKAYKAVGKIKWENEYHRKDIGYRALGRDT